LPPASYTLSLHDALPIFMDAIEEVSGSSQHGPKNVRFVLLGPIALEAWLPEATSRNRILKLYEQATRQLAENRQARFVGLTWLWPEAEKEAGFKHKRTDDGIHLDQLGYNLVAGSIERA